MLIDFSCRPPEGQEDHKEEERVERKKEKTRGGKNNLLMAEPTQADPGTGETDGQEPGSSGWTQKQQKSLETALTAFPKGCSERWTKFLQSHFPFQSHFTFWFKQVGTYRKSRAGQNQGKKRLPFYVLLFGRTSY